uniref:Sphingoid long-chain bases kinase 1 n=1 Tax=Aegilops tauschii TaxID=37682 RepID=M8BQV1_AEGTA
MEVTASSGVAVVSAGRRRAGISPWPKTTDPSKTTDARADRRQGSRSPETTSTEKEATYHHRRKTSNTKFLKQKNVEGASKDPEKGSTHDNRIEDEKSDLLGYEVCSGKLTLDNKGRSVSGEQSGSGSSGNCFDARLTTEALVWGSNILKLEDIVSVSYNAGLRHFTVHACPLEKRSNGLSCFMKPRRIQKDLRFLSTAPHEAFRWVNGFADQQCYVNLLPHPMASSKKHSSELIPFDAMLDPYVKCRSPPKILVILNPRSGHGRSSKVFHGKVEPIFKELYVSVAMELLTRDDQIEAGSLPIGIIPAGSDNSLVWTVLGVKDPISAALSIVRGGFTPIDVFSVEWIQSGTTHFGTTVSYFGFVSDVLELSEKYQKRFGPLRYIVAGFLKFLCLPKYSFELEYLPAADVDGAGHKIVEGQEKVDTSDLYDDVVQRSRAECLPRASSLSSIDSIMSTSIMSGGEPEVSSPRANNEPSELVRALDPKSKRQSLGRTSTFKEPEESLHPQASTPSWRRSKSKSRTEKAWPGLTATNDTKSSKGTTTHDKEDTSSTISDPGPAWDTGPKWDMEPKWDNQPNWEPETPIELHGPSDDIELGLTKELVPSLDERWVIRKGRYLGVLVCNHSCKTVQSLSSQIVAPKAEYDDNCLDLLLVGGSGRLRLLRFLVLLQFGKHISLPNVEYVKVRSVRLKAGPNTHDGCGIDGELLHVKGQNSLADRQAHITPAMYIRA